MTPKPENMLKALARTRACAYTIRIHTKSKQKRPPLCQRSAFTSLQNPNAGKTFGSSSSGLIAEHD